MQSASRTSWWTVARAWADTARDLPHGVVQTRLTQFAVSLGVVDLTVRRAAAALRFADRLVQQNRIDRSESLKDVAITYLEILQRIDRFDPAEVDRLLPAIIAGVVSGPELRACGTRLRQTDKTRSVTDGALLRMSAPQGRSRVLDLLEAPDSPLKGRLVRVRLSRSLRPLPMDAVIVSADNRAFQGVRVFAAIADASHPRNVAYAVLLELAASRVLDGFYLVFEDGQMAADAMTAIRGWEAAGVGVIWLTPEGILTVEMKAAEGRVTDPELQNVRTQFLENLACQERT